MSANSQESIENAGFYGRKWSPATTVKFFVEVSCHTSQHHWDNSGGAVPQGPAAYQIKLHQTYSTRVCRGKTIEDEGTAWWEKLQDERISEGWPGSSENACSRTKMEMGFWGNSQTIRTIDLSCESWKENKVLSCWSSSSIVGHFIGAGPYTSTWINISVNVETCTTWHTGAFGVFWTTWGGTWIPSLEDTRDKMEKLYAERGKETTEMVNQPSERRYPDCNRKPTMKLDFWMFCFGFVYCRSYDIIKC